MMKWLGSSSEPKDSQNTDEIDGQYTSRSGSTAEPETAHERGSSQETRPAGILQVENPSASDGHAPDKLRTCGQPRSSGMRDIPQEQPRQSRKRPLADADDSDAEDAPAPEAAKTAPAYAPSRRGRVPLRPSGTGSSARPSGKPASPEAVPSFMGMPSQPLPVRPSQREAAAAPQGKGYPQGAAHGSTLRQTYNFSGDPEKHPQVVDTSSSSGGSGHFDPTNQMILRLEYLKESDVKWAIFFIHVAEFIGLVVLILYLVAKLKTDDNYFIRDNTLVVVNLCFGVLLWLALIEVFVIYIQHVVRTNRLRRHWSFRRYRTTVVLLAETISQIINLCFFILPNAYVLAKPCGWRDPVVLWSSFVSFSCWNTVFLVLVVRVHNINLWLDRDGQPRGGRMDATIVDAPWITHAPKLILWAAAEAFKATATVIIIQRSALRPYYIPPGGEGDCRLWLYECHHSPIAQIMLILESATLLVYLALFVYYLLRAFSQLSIRNFRDFRMSNQSVRLILRTRFGAIVFFAASVIVFYYVHLGSCATWISSSLGFLPMHIVMTAIIIVMLYWFMPTDPDAQDQVLQAWLQEFAWTEAEKLQKWRMRAGNLRLTSAALHELNKEPMFCFESAIKLYYYSHIIYHYDKLEGFRSSCGADEKRDEVTHIGMFRRRLAQSMGHRRAEDGTGADASAAGDPSQSGHGSEGSSAGTDRSASAQKLAVGPVTDSNLATGPNPGVTAAKLKATSKAKGGNGSSSGSGHGTRGNHRGQPKTEDFSLDTALRLYGLERMEVLWERRLDTMALIAWGSNRIVVVFRGTSSLKNVLADLEAWQTPFPPNQAGNHFWERPAVHNGFYQSYTANDFGKKVVRRVCELVSSYDWEWTKILVTGHSLGGALATLAAYDISRAMEWVSKPTKVICYTFGAPRVGNHAFAHTYNKMVPETWNIVNDQDAVARRCNFCFLYKRPGQRVIINKRGDMLVRPTFIELTLNQTPLTTSVHDHFLLSYRDALAEICKAQINRKKRLEGGLAGVLALLEGDEFVRGILEPAGLTMDVLDRPSIIASYRKLDVPPPSAGNEPTPAIGPILPKSAPSLGAPLPPASAFQAAMPEPQRDTGIELQQQPSLERSSTSSASSYKTAYAQSFASALSADDVSGAGLGSARPSTDTEISLAGFAHDRPDGMLDRARDSAGGSSAADMMHHERPGVLADGAQDSAGSESFAAVTIHHEESGSMLGRAQHSRGSDASAAGIPQRRAGLAPDSSQHSGDTDVSLANMGDGRPWAQVDSMQSSAEGDKSRPYLHTNGHGPHTEGRGSPRGMEHTSGATETRGAAGSFPGFWRDNKGDDAAAAGLASGAAAGVAAAKAGKDSQRAQGLEPVKDEANADSSMASVEQHQKVPQAENTQKAPLGLAAQHQSLNAKTPGASHNTAATAPPGSTYQDSKGEHDLMVATGYTGPSGLLRRRDDMTGKQAIEQLLKAQRTGGAVAPEVRIAAAYALANGAADAKRRRDANRTAQEACQQQTTDTEGAAPVSAEAAHSGASTAIPSNEYADMSNATSPEEDSGSPQRSARLLQTQPNTPHPYRINPEFYRAGSSGSTGSGPGIGRFSGSGLATAGTVEDDAAVPPPSSDDLSTTEDESETIEKRSGSWLGWLPWSRASGSPRADAGSPKANLGSPQADALSRAERGESRSSTEHAPAVRSNMTDSSRVDAISGAEPGDTSRSTGASKPTPDIPSTAPGSPRDDALGTPQHRKMLQATAFSNPAEHRGPTEAAVAAAAGAASQDGCSTEKIAQSALPRAANKDTDASKSLQDTAGNSEGVHGDGPITPERAEAPRKAGKRSAPAGPKEAMFGPAHAQSLESHTSAAADPNASRSQQSPSPASHAWADAGSTHASHAMGSANQHTLGVASSAEVAADNGHASQAGYGYADSPFMENSYSSFYPEDPEPSSSLDTSTGNERVRRSVEVPYTACETSLSLWSSPQRPQRTQADAAETSLQPHNAPNAQTAGSNSLDWVSLEGARGTKSEGEERFVAPDAYSRDGAASQQLEAAEPFRFMGSDSAPTTPTTRSLKKKSGRRVSQFSSTSSIYEGSQDLGIFSSSKNPGEAGSDDDTSPRSRAMSKYLSGRQHSGAITGPTESQTGISEKSTAQPAVQDTPLKQSQDPAAVLDDSSPPRVRRKATPRELAEEFKGHGLKQAEWAPIPIYWAKDGSQAPAQDT